MRTVIIKYNAGNIRSVTFAMERLGVNALVTDDHEAIRAADKVILPGVGEASSAMQFLREKKMDELIRSLKQPVLGICLGMQLMCTFSEEGNTSCLGIFPKTVKRFKGEKVPQIGWNNVIDLKSGLFSGIRENDYMYFVHGYYVELGENTIASTEYGVKYSSSIQKDNFYATQFHPEKSGKAGEHLLRNFLAL